MLFQKQGYQTCGQRVRTTQQVVQFGPLNGFAYRLLYIRFTGVAQMRGNWAKLYLTLMT